MPEMKHIFLGILLALVVYFGVHHFRGRKYLPVQMAEGTTGVLPCDITGTLKEVAWKKVERFWPDRTLVTYDVNSGKRRGSGYEEGRFNIRKDYDLEINKVKDDDSGDYYCVMKSMADELVLSDRIVTVKVFENKDDAYTPMDVLYFLTIIILIILVVIGITSYYMYRGGRLERFILKLKKYRYNGRISYYELWQLASHAVKDREGDKLIDAVKSLMNASPPDPHISSNSVDDLYGLLRSWKKRCGKHGRPLNQLYKKCIEAGMEINIQKLKDRRQMIRGVEGPTSDDMRHVLRQIDQHSNDNITKLLGELRIENTTDSGLEHTIERALEKMEEWKQGPLSMNPNVLLSFALEDLKLTDGEKKMLTGIRSGHHR